MLPFRVGERAWNWWFKPLRDEKSFSIGFDAFYFCFIAGLCEGRKEDLRQDETEELVSYFPERYKARGRLLVALFLISELRKLGITMQDKKEVHSVIAKLISRDAQNFLSEEGVREFNRYAYGGYEVLQDWFDGDQPRTLDVFLRVFQRKVNELLPSAPPSSTHEVK
ncbi:MAG: hypothetical protein OXH60_04505 [Rhodospirillales bacterium]|nr:hypothetical protein [Rhodospirillales bacterium]